MRSIRPHHAHEAVSSPSILLQQRRAAARVVSAIEMPVSFPVCAIGRFGDSDSTEGYRFRLIDCFASGDQGDTQYPVFHDLVSHVAGELSDWTLATALFSLDNRTMTMCVPQPARCL
jgi:hypothetical protein